MNIYYTGIKLTPCATGFGTYTGLILVNSGNFPITYTATVSDTVLQGINVNTDIINSSNINTIFITNDLSDVNVNDSSVQISINPSDSGFLYIAHRPFKDFTTAFKSTGNINGNEKASITINSLSSIGDFDNNIIIDVTGQRTGSFVKPPNVGSFYGVEDYNKTDKFLRNFFWQVHEPSTYATSFDLEVSQNSDFSSSTVYQYPVLTNSDSNYPLFGKYKTLSDIQFNEKRTNLTVGQNFYARLRSVNPYGYGDWSYATGFDTYTVTLDGTGYSGLYPSPGDNLKVNLKKLNLIRLDDFEIDFDLYSFLVSQNRNSLDFSRYSGVNIKFASSNQGFCKYIASSTTSGAINLNIPQNGNLILGTNNDGKFIIELEFENCGLFGHGGEGLKWRGISASLQQSDYSNPLDGGPIFNLDDKNLSNTPIEYYIYKDVDSIFYAGAGGGKGWLINDDTTVNLQSAILIDGVKIRDLSDTILTSPLP